jgi:hypothetical protein
MCNARTRTLLLLSILLAMFIPILAGPLPAQLVTSLPADSAILPTIERVNMFKSLDGKGRNERKAEGDNFTAHCLEKAAEADLLSFGCRGRTHLGSSEAANRYFGGLKIGNAIALSVGDNRATLYTELISDNVFTLGRLGFARAGFGALVANADTTETTEQQFFNGGGNGVGFVMVPFYRWVNAVRDGSSIQIQRRADLNVITALRGDIPALNQAVDNPAASFYAGTRLDFTQHSSANRFRFFLTADGGWVRGTRAYYRNLQVENASWYGDASAQITAGIDLNQLFRIGLTSGWSTVEDIHLPWRLAVQLLPQ